MGEKGKTRVIRSKTKAVLYWTTGKELRHNDGKFLTEEENA